MSGNNLDEVFIGRIECLLNAAKSGNHDEVNRLIDELSANRETSLYKQVGQLTRDLHESFKSFSNDSRIEKLANEDCKDAQERLHFVVQKTQQAADSTLTQIENSFPLCESLISSSEDLSKDWSKLLKKQMNAEEFRKLSKNIKDFLQTANKDGKALKDNLNIVLMSQDFQDITGQVVHKVIALIEDIERALVELIRLASEHKLADVNEHKVTDNSTQKEYLSGPVVPNVNDMNATVSGQDEVDDLLSSLGF